MRALRAKAASIMLCLLAGPLLAEAGHRFGVVQKGRVFSVSAITIGRGDTIRFSNQDGFLHQIFVHSEAFTIDSDEQRPGQDIDITFPVSGKFQVLCAIHPRMALTVQVP